MDGVVVITIDVEDYYMSPETIRVAEWANHSDRLAVGFEKVLDILAHNNLSATFFWLGYLALQHPCLVRNCAEAGHELAVHGWDHRPVWMLGPHGFRDSIQRTKSLLEDLTGQPVIGHRAPEYSLDWQTPWMWQTLADTGFLYDSSLIAVTSYLFGDRTNPPIPILRQTNSHPILVMPIATVSCWGTRLPLFSGGFARALPLWWAQWGFRVWTRLHPISPPVINLHPWELDPHHPRLPLPLKQRLIHHIGLAGFESKTRRFLHNKTSVTLGNAYNDFCSAIG